MDIVIASNNLHKIEEYREIFQGWEGKILSMKDAGIFVSPEENGATFQENSLIKARACAERTDKVVLADDSGLIIPSLPDILGVETSRFLGENTPYPVKWAEILRRLEGKNREARFVCCITVVNLSEKPAVFVGECLGSIGERPEGNTGFGYDPIFIPEGYDRSFACLGEDLKNRISHRARATEKMIAWLKENFDENFID